MPLDFSHTPVHDNLELQRFEVQVGGVLAVAEYRRTARTITFTHTEVPRELRGRGLGSHLVGVALERARAEGLRVVPRCPFVAAYLRRHPHLRSTTEL